MVVKIESMVLSGAEYGMTVMAAFPLSLVVILSSVPFFIDIDILDFFSQTVLIPFLPFLSGGSRICRGQNYPRLCLKTTWTFITHPRLYPSSTRALGPNVKMGQDHKLLGPTIAPQNPTVRPLSQRGGFWQCLAFITIRSALIFISVGVPSSI